MPMAWSTAATSAATGRASGKFATEPRPSAISFSPACASIAPSSQCSSVTMPAAFAALAAASRAASSAARSGSDRNILMLACPSGEGGDLACGQRGGVRHDRVEEPVDRGLGRGTGHLPGGGGTWRLLRACFVGHRVVMLPIVVMPPAIAAFEPDQKSSTQIGNSSRSRSPWCTRWACASIPPGIASRPEAASSRVPVIVPPSWAIRPSVMPMSAASE
jgi:hypothetical protein